METPMFDSRVAAGFPSPADDHLETPLDLNDYLVERPAATFLLRAEGESMLGAGIYPGDLLVVDRGQQATHGDIIIAALNGDLTVKRLKKREGRIFLQPENPEFPELEVSPEMEMEIWGVVRHAIHSY
jgi:DNA polymerase V